jgi:hypothetical protein
MQTSYIWLAPGQRDGEDAMQGHDRQDQTAMFTNEELEWRSCVQNKSRGVVSESFGVLLRLARRRSQWC